MKNKKLYNLGCILGGGLLFLYPIVKRFISIDLAIGMIDLASIGSLILGITLVTDYYSYHGDAEQYKNWWKQIAGFFFMLLFVPELLPLPDKVSAGLNIFLYLGFLMALYMRYNQIQK